MSTTVSAEAWPMGLPLTEENINKMAQEHHLYLVQDSYALPILPDPDAESWTQITASTKSDPALLRDQLRELSTNVPSAARVLNLYKMYTIGGGATVVVRPSDPELKVSNQVTKRATNKLRNQLRRNSIHLGFGEMARRLYRDGELFIRRIKNETGYDYRFVDPENICDEDGNENGGIITDPYDTVTVLGYMLCKQKFDEQGNPDGYEKYAEVLPEDMLHIALDVDSTVKRGVSRMLGCKSALQRYRSLILNEVTLRERQSAIVMVRKVAGGSGAARSVLDAAKTQTSEAVDAYSGQERYRAGTVATTTKGVEITFSHPDNNFSDAGPLFSLLDREVAKVTGFTFEQISCNTTEGSLATAMIAEGPTFQMIAEERNFLAARLEKYFLWLLEDFQLSDDYVVDIDYPPVATVDKLKVAQACNIGVMAKAMSIKEMSRQLGLDPEQQRTEVEGDSTLPFINPAYGNQNPGAGAKATSSKGNASAGGTNQGGSPAGGSMDLGKQGFRNQ